MLTSLYNDRIVLIHGNCFSVDVQKVDTIIADIPYVIGYADWDLFDFDAFFSKYKHKFSDNFLVFAGWSHAGKVKDIAEKNKLLCRNRIIWDRIKGRGAKYNLVSTAEDILWFAHQEKSTFNRIDSTIKKKTKGMGITNGSEYRRLSNVWTDISPIVPWSKEKVNHPTQKPITLIERIIQVFTNDNDLVLDPVMGSGTSAVACIKTNRRFIGIETNEQYFKIAVDRCKQFLGE